MQQKVILNISKAIAISYMDGAGDRVRNTLWKFFEGTKMKRSESSVLNKSKIWSSVDEAGISLKPAWNWSNCRLPQWLVSHLSLYCYKNKLLAEVCMENNVKKNTVYTAGVLEGLETSCLLDKTFVHLVRQHNSEIQLE